MLEAKLKAAKKQTAVRNKKLILIGFTLVVCVGFVFYAMSFIDSDIATPAAHGDSVTNVVSADEIEARAPTNQPVAKGIEGRDEFINGLKKYESELESELKLYDIKTWVPDTEKTISDIKEKAVSSFAAGGYGEANQQLAHLRSLTQNTIKNAHKTYNDEYAKAGQFFANDDYENAKHHIENVLMIDPVSIDAINLQKEIMALPRLIDLLDQIKAANAENNNKKELQLLTEALKIAPDRRGLSDRHDEVTNIILEERFNTEIFAAQNNLSASKHADARQHLKNAAKIFPNRVEISVVELELLEREKDTRVAAQLSNALEAVKKDDWQAALNAYKNAEKDARNNKTVVEGLRISKEILNLKKSLGGYAASPYKLKNDSVKSQAVSKVDTSKNYHALSFSLRRSAEGLTQLIDKMNTKIAVNVSSDNQTYIIVRGIGKIGTTTQKQIKLKPGNYIFEGSRQGYKSKLVAVLIPYDKAPSNVEVICDERI